MSFRPGVSNRVAGTDATAPCVEPALVVVRDTERRTSVMSQGIQHRLLAAQPDERLLALARHGHERAFEAVVHRYRRPLMRYCRRRLALSEARAEDVVQQALLNAWVALRRGAEVRELRPWLYRIVHNVAVNAMRSERPPGELEVAERADPSGARAAAAEGLLAPSIDETLEVRDALASMAALPPMQREVMVRTAVGGHSHEEVASALGISDGAVRGLLYRARASIRAAAAAVVPSPLIAWAAGASAPSGVASERIADLAAGGGVAGLAGLAAKGAVAVIAAGAIITGAALTPSHRAPSRSHAQRVAPRRAVASRPGRSPAGASGARAGSDAAGTDAAGSELTRSQRPLASSRRSHHGAHRDGSRRAMHERIGSMAPRRRTPALSPGPAAEVPRSSEAPVSSDRSRHGAGEAPASSAPTPSRPARSADEPPVDALRRRCQAQ